MLFPDEPPPHSNEERRAPARGVVSGVLGNASWSCPHGRAFSLARRKADGTKSVATGFGKIQPMKYSSYVQTCLRELQENIEYETDEILGHTIRLQNLSEKIADGTAGTRDRRRRRYLALLSLPTSLPSRTELDKIQSSISKTMKNNSKSLRPSPSLGLHGRILKACQNISWSTSTLPRYASTSRPWSTRRSSANSTET